MSVFILDAAHINALVSWAALHKVRYTWKDTTRTITGNEAHAAATMHAANLASYCARYNEPQDPEGEAPHTFRADWRTLDFSAVQILKAANCYQYQSAEAPGWERSEACAIFEAIRATAIRNLPGYEAAAWHISEHEHTEREALQ